MRKTWSHVCSATVVGARSKASRRTVIPELGRLHGEEVLDGLGDCALEAAGGAWHLLLLAGKPQRGGRGHLQLQVPRENQGVHQGFAMRCRSLPPAEVKNSVEARQQNLH